MSDLTQTRIKPLRRIEYPHSDRVFIEFQVSFCDGDRENDTWVSSARVYEVILNLSVSEGKLLKHVDTSVRLKHHGLIATVDRDLKRIDQVLPHLKQTAVEFYKTSAEYTTWVKSERESK